MSRLVIVAGMPGSGKSTYLQAQKARFDVVYDDWRGHQLGKNTDPRLNKHYSELLSHLEQHHTVAVSDVMFCIPQYCHEFLAAVLSVLPGTNVDYIFFDNNPEACRKNVLSRDRGERNERELALIDSITKEYAAPTATKEKVYEP